MRAIAPRGRVNHVRRKNGIRREARGASFALWTSAGVQKSRTGREISCQLQSAIDRGRERRSEGGNERLVTGTEGGGGFESWEDEVVETMKESGSKAPGFWRDLCEIPAMLRVKKKTAPRCVPALEPRDPRTPPGSPSFARRESSGNGNGRDASFRCWRSPAFRSIFRGTGKRTARKNWPRPGSRFPKWFAKTR